MLMPTVRISEEVDQEIRKLGGFGDTHDSVLRRVLGLDKTPEQKPKRAPHGSVTPADKYRDPILRVLLAAPGYRAVAADTIAEVGKLMKGQFTEFDTQATSSGAIRWVNNVQWQRDSMVKEGLLEPTAVVGRGIWKLTSRGIAEAKKLR
jgi:hypothetical protein